MDLLDRMLGHDHWATLRVLEISRDLTDAQLDREFDIGHRTLRETLDHMIFVVGAWTTLMLEQPAGPLRDGRRSVMAREGRRSIAELVEQHERFHPAFAITARRAQDEQRLDDTFVDHYDFRQSQGATILQVMHHNAQHRAEARHILERLGVPDLWDLDPQEWEHVGRADAPASERESE
ncbi:MAG TPA: DinB family protein [Thermomicrobiales bacterium]|nr:DinB family protein [Thermomicrobiales bacterium]